MRDLLAVAAVLVDAREDVERVVPAAEDGQVARRVRVRERRRERAAVAPVLGLEVAVGRLADGVELDARVDGEDALQPDAVVCGVLAAEPAALDVPDARLRSSIQSRALGSAPAAAALAAPSAGARADAPGRARSRPRTATFMSVDGRLVGARGRYGRAWPAPGARVDRRVPARRDARPRRTGAALPTGRHAPPDGNARERASHGPDLARPPRARRSRAQRLPHRTPAARRCVAPVFV